jgi:hypothetical protein
LTEGTHRSGRKSVKVMGVKGGCSVFLRIVECGPDEGERFVPDDIDAMGFVVDVIRFSCIAPSGPPGQGVTWTEIPSSFVAVRGWGLSPVPPMPMMPEPGI